MEPRRKVPILWCVIGALVAVLLLPLYGPLRTAWSCYRLHDNGEREQARVLEKLEEHGSFALLIEEGSHAGDACTADTSKAIFAATERGDTLEVVYVDWKPGTCELSSTIEASAQLLWILFAGLAFVIGSLLAFGLFLQRSFTRPAHPARRMAVDARDVRCPACGKAMDEGYVPLLSGVHWRRPGEPIGLPHALAGLPGTVGWKGRPRLHAFRCAPCEILTLQYGDPPGRRSPPAAVRSAGSGGPGR
jgi:hypothetical protein